MPPKQYRKKKSNTTSPENHNGYLCLECELALAGENIECHMCKKWCHQECTELNVHQYEVLKTGGDCLVWRCKRCIEEGAKNERPRLEEKIERMSCLIEQMMGRLANVEKDIDDRLKKIEIDVDRKIEETVKKYVMKQEESVEIQISQALERRNDEEDRKRNLVILGIAESNEDEEKELDVETVKKVLEIVNPGLNIETGTTTRLGRRRQDATKPRPLKVILPDEATKFKILKKAKSLKGSNFEKISIQEDLSKEQQERNYKLRQQLKQRREAGEKVYIYRGELISEKDRQTRKKAPEEAK